MRSPSRRPRRAQEAQAGPPSPDPAEVERELRADAALPKAKLERDEAKLTAEVASLEEMAEKEQRRLDEAAEAAGAVADAAAARAAEANRQLAAAEAAASDAAAARTTEAAAARTAEEAAAPAEEAEEAPGEEPVPYLTPLEVGPPEDREEILRDLFRLLDDASGCTDDLNRDQAALQMFIDAVEQGERARSSWGSDTHSRMKTDHIPANASAFAKTCFSTQENIEDCRICEYMRQHGRFDIMIGFVPLGIGNISGTTSTTCCSCATTVLCPAAWSWTTRSGRPSWTPARLGTVGAEIGCCKSSCLIQFTLAYRASKAYTSLSAQCSLSSGRNHDPNGRCIANCDATATRRKASSRRSATRRPGRDQVVRVHQTFGVLQRF